MFDFRVEATAGSARAGTLSLPHGEVRTPAFMPVGTHAVVRGLHPSEVLRTGAQIILANAYHLHLRPGEDESGSGARGVDGTAEEREFWMWLDALARSLPARQREVLLLRYQRDLTDAEIGEVLGLSESGVRSLAARAIAALRRHPELWS